MSQLDDEQIAHFIGRCQHAGFDATPEQAAKFLDVADSLDEAVEMYAAKMKAKAPKEESKGAPSAPPTKKGFFDSIVSFFSTGMSEMKRRKDGVPQINIVVIGETGSGKSTFVNLFLNALSGRGVGDLRDAIDHTKDNRGNVAGQSVTDDCTEYRIECAGGRLVLLDTPGFGDTRGTEVTEGHVRTVGNSIANLGLVNAIIIVVNGTNARYTATAKYVFTNIGLLLPEQARENVIVVATNCRDIIAVNLPVEAFMGECGLKTKVDIFCFDNPLGVWANVVKNRPAELNTRQMQDTLQARFAEAQQQCEKLVGKLFQLPSHPTNQFRDLVLAQQNAALSFSNFLQESIEFEKFRVELSRVRANISTYAQSAQGYAGFAGALRVPKLVRKDTTQPNTLCLAPNCGSNCHQPCSLDFGAPLTNCVCFHKDNACSTCGHAMEQHGHYMYYNTHETEAQDDPDMKAKFDAAKDKEAQEQALLAGVERRRADVEARLNASRSKAMLAVKVFAKVASQRSYAVFLQAKKELIKEQLASIDPKYVTCLKCGGREAGGVLLGCKSEGRSLFHVLCAGCSARHQAKCPVCLAPRSAHAESQLTEQVILANHPQIAAMKQLLVDLDRILGELTAAAGRTASV